MRPKAKTAARPLFHWLVPASQCHPRPSLLDKNKYRFEVKCQCIVQATKLCEHGTDGAISVLKQCRSTDIGAWIERVHQCRIKRDARRIVGQDVGVATVLPISVALRVLVRGRRIRLREVVAERAFKVLGDTHVETANEPFRIDVERHGRCTVRVQCINQGVHVANGDKRRFCAGHDNASRGFVATSAWRKCHRAEGGRGRRRKETGAP